MSSSQLLDAYTIIAFKPAAMAKVEDAVAHGATNLMEAHPRGRGFLVVSRLAREGRERVAASPCRPAETSETAASDVLPAAATDDGQQAQEPRSAPVVPLVQPTATPRHRREDALGIAL
jgi:hypothetical protein